MSDNPNTKRQGYGNPALRGTINRAGRTPSSLRLKEALEENHPTTYSEAGAKELAALFRKVKPHVRRAIAVMHEIMVKPDASDTVKMAASKQIVEIYIQSIKEAYMNQKDKLLDPNSEESNLDTQPAAVFHLKVVDKLEDANKT